MSRSGSDSNRKPDLTFGPISRRSLLRKGAGVAAIGVVPGLLAACGGGGSSTASSTSSSTSTTAAEPVGGTVNFIGFQGADQKQVLKQFYKQNGITLNSTYIGSMSDIVAKFAGGGGGGIDLVEYGSSGNMRLQESGVKLMPLDLEQIPNWKYVEEFVELTGAPIYSNEAGEIVAVPYAWGALGITYDASKTAEPKSWKELTEPKYKGKLTVVDDPSTNYDLAAEVLGFSAAEMSQDQFAEVNEFMKEILENAKQISPTFGDMTNLLASEEVEVAFGGWSAINTFAAEAGNPHIKTNLEPEEGGGVFVEQFGISEGSSNKGSCYAIINQLIEPKVNAAAASAVVEASVSKGAQKYQPKEIVDLYVTESEYAKYFKSSSVSLDPPAVSDEFVTFGEATEGWNQLKAEV